MSTAAMTRRRFVKLGAAAAGTVVLGGGALKAATWAPETERPMMTMGDGTMKTLVVYGTKSGCTTGIAERIGEILSARGANVEVVPAESAPDPAGYDAVVVGSGIRVGQWHEPARTWVEANADALSKRPVAFYTVCLTLTDPAKADEVRAYTDPLIASSGVKPVGLGTFTGWFEPKRFSFLERTVMRVMKAPEGDHRDFSAVSAWAEGIAPQLGLA